MFEKESKEYANKWLEHVKDLELQHKSDDKPEYINILEAHRKGAEFGYNKANEWHFVKDELPKEEGDFLFYLYDKETKDTFCEVFGIARTYADRDDMHIESMLWTLDDVIAWKEIVLPELPKESE